MKTKTFLSCLLALVFIHAASAQQNLKVWDNKPAEQWEENFPLGNGRLGMMPDGNVQNETIILNDITLWSGGPQDANNYKAHEYLPTIRKLLKEGKNEQAQTLINKNFICTGKGSEGVNYGCYQVLGSLHLKFNYPTIENVEAETKNYHRQLLLSEAVASCSYQKSGVNYKREYFTSFLKDVDVIRITADKPNKINLEITVDRPERGSSAIHSGALELAGQLDNGTDGKGMRYLAKIKAVNEGGNVAMTENKISVNNATTVTIYISVGTNFKDEAYLSTVEKQLSSAISVPYQQHKKAHIDIFGKWFKRVVASIGQVEKKDDVPTWKRLADFRQAPNADIGLPMLLFHFGRYLSICSTRVGLLLPNLQGLWANQINTPWNGDYHLDVNIQMNQWPVEVVNLSELNLPLVDLMQGMVAQGQKTAKAYYNADGWIAHMITNVWGFTEPGESASWGICKCGTGWLCNNLWEHYTFTEDKQYLKKIYPLLKGAAQFYSSTLDTDDKTGWLVTSPSSSPENSFYLPNGSTASVCVGPTIDNQILRELFTNVIAASKMLNTDEAFRKSLEEKILKLPPAGQIAKDGSLMEWLEDYKATDPQHRHVSHLYGLFPAPLITPSATPQLAEACKKTLNIRGDDGPSWSIAYKILWWARLQDGNRAYQLLKELLKPTLKTHINYGAGGGVYPNLLSAGPPFQIDGNFGSTAGIAEMLIQSHEGFISLLPAIPDEWKTSGHVKGLKARGNYTVNMDWKDGKITNFKILSKSPAQVKVRVNDEIKLVKTEVK